MTDNLSPQLTPEQRVVEILKDRLPIDLHHYQYQELAAEILSSLTTEDEPIAGVTFGDGEFVPIEDESIMQWIAEQLSQQEDNE